MKTRAHFLARLQSCSRAVVFALAGASLASAENARVEITVIDKANRRPLPCRIHLKDAAGKPQRADNLPFWRDHFVCPGAVQLELPAGEYSYEIERGPEYLLRTGSLSVSEKAIHKTTIELERFVDLAAEGWWSGELHVHRPPQDIELLMRAEDLHVAPVITWWNNQNRWTNQAPPARTLVQFDGHRFYDVMAGEDEREGGALLYFHLTKPLAIAGSSREFPSPLKFVAAAREHKGVWIDIEKPFWWDAPVWLASGQCDSIGLANNHLCRDQMYESEAWGKPRDIRRLPPPRGNGFWTQEIYYHVLNCGLRIPPSAGSASGVLPNPVGYNRVYVFTGSEFSWPKWWEGLRAGRSFVSNGPLLRCRVNGELPGHVFTAGANETVDLEIKASLSTRDPVSSLEIIRNGRVERSVPFAEWQKTGSLGRLSFTESGWFLIRVITDNSKTFRFASTAPYFVEIGERKQRISKASARFFLDWVRERMDQIKLTDPAQKEEVLGPHRMAEKFWQGILDKATAE